MNRNVLSLILVSLSFLVPAFAQAQDEIPGRHEIAELRSTDSRCPEGFRCFIAGELASYEQMLSRVNAHIADDGEHVTFEQFAAANQCRVIFRRADGDMRLNGVCSYNHTPERIVEADFCGDQRCQRWIMASSSEHVNIYRVPAVRVLTPSERAEQMVRSLNAIDPVTQTVPAPAELGGMLTELATLMEAPQPPSHAQEHEVVLAMGSALARTPATASGAPAPSSAPADMAELESLHAQVATLTAERDEALASSSVTPSGLPLWSLITFLVGLAAALFIGLGLGRNQNKPLQELLTLKPQHADLVKERAQLETALETAKRTIQRLETEAKEKKRLSENSLSPQQAQELGVMKFLRKMADGALKTKESAEHLILEIGGYHDVQMRDLLQRLIAPTLDQFELVGAWGLAFPGIPFDAKGIESVPRAHKERLERAMGTAKDQGRSEAELALGLQRSNDRKEFEAEVDKLNGELEEKRRRVLELENQIEARQSLEGHIARIESAPSKPDSVPIAAVRIAYGMLHGVYRGVFGSILTFDPVLRRKVVNENRVKDKFSKAIQVYPANGTKPKRLNGKDVVTRHELREEDLYNFLRETHDGLDQLVSEFLSVLGIVDTRADLTPLPGPIPIAAIPPEAVPPAEAVPATAPGQDSLLDNPDETETTEMAAEPTRFAQNPLLVAPPKSKERDDEATQVVHRPRRRTDIGIGGEAIKPEAEAEAPPAEGDAKS
jgi:hypothetical protein